jgi:hypothetical protein
MAFNATQSGFAFKGGSKVKYVEDDDYHTQLQQLYSNVLDAKGINLADPILANIKYFNKQSQRFTTDPPYVGKTYIFVTRPDLNLSGGAIIKDKKDKIKVNTGYANVKNVSMFDYMSNTEIGQQIAPFLMYPSFRSHLANWKDYADGDPNGTKIIDRNYFGGIDIVKNQSFQPFIPLFSNLCTSTSGGKDLTLETYETEGDFSGNKLQYAKGMDEVFSIGEVNLECKDIYGTPLTHLINLWVTYIHYLGKGVVTTRKEYIRERIIDYTSSIYIFMTDRDQSTLLRWIKYTGCFPKSLPLGQVQHNVEPNVEGLRDLSIAFAYNRYEVMKPEIIGDFNYLMSKFIGQKNPYTATDSIAPPPELNFTPLAVRNAMDTVVNGVNAIYPSYVLRNADGTVQNERAVKLKPYHDSIYWGKYPYILDGKLVWYEGSATGTDYSKIKSTGDAQGAAMSGYH